MSRFLPSLDGHLISPGEVGEKREEVLVEVEAMDGDHVIIT